MKQIDYLLVTSSGGDPSLNTNEVRASLRRAGFKEGDLISVVLTSDLAKQAPAAPDLVEGLCAAAATKGALRAGQRRRFSLAPESFFTVLGQVVGKPQYWRCEFPDGDGVRVVEYLGSFIEGRSLIVLEKAATEGPIVKKIVAGQRRVVNHDPQAPFTVIEQDSRLACYWKVRYDGDPGVEATFGEEYIHNHSTVVETPAAPLPPFRWWICYQSGESRHRLGATRVLARSEQSALNQANLGYGGPDYKVAVLL